jgi:hypothetical protein
MVVYYFIQIIRYISRSYDHLQGEIYTSEIKSIQKRLQDDRMTVWPKHVADNLNKTVNNHRNRVPLDGNPLTWSNTRNRMQTPKFQCVFFLLFDLFRVLHTAAWQCSVRPTVILSQRVTVETCAFGQLCAPRVKTLCPLDTDHWLFF